MSWYDYDGDFPQYESVGAKRAKAQLAARKLTDKGSALTPAVVKGTKLASTFWGQAWNKNLERYQQYDNRLPRGRSYVRNGMVIHLEIEKGGIKALVSGTSLYEVSIHIEPLAIARWKALKHKCAGQISSLVSLLQGKIPPSMMELVTAEKEGLFPEPKDIRFICTCPDYADLCKHSSAALYGVGARLDENPELLFQLRGVDHTEIISNASEAIVSDVSLEPSTNLVGDLSDIFGIELDSFDAAPAPAPPPEPDPESEPEPEPEPPKVEKIFTPMKKLVIPKRSVSKKKKSAKKTSKKSTPAVSAKKAAKPSAKKIAKPAAKKRRDLG